MLGLAEAHEHDHFPLPFRHGGRETVAACYRCHTLKDRVPLHRWTAEDRLSANAGIRGAARELLVLIAEQLWAPSPDDDPRPLWVLHRGDLLTACVDDCDTPEARIAVAASFAAYLDQRETA